MGVKMILREIEFDLPYQKNVEYINKIKQEEKLDYDEAVLRDYECNWESKRREFQLMTRCMTSMIERLMEKAKTDNYRKILVECYESPKDFRIKNALGVCVVPIWFRVDQFFHADNRTKKTMVINAIYSVIDTLAKETGDQLLELKKVCKIIQECDYTNEWLYKKPVKRKNYTVQIGVKHEVDEVSVYLVIADLTTNQQRKVPIVSTLPDERCYYMYASKVQWVSDNEVVLKTKDGNIISKKII